LDRHQGEATTSQLGWHPTEPPSYTVNLGKNFIKKKGEKITSEGTRPKPSTKKKKQKKEIPIKEIQ